MVKKYLLGFSALAAVIFLVFNKLNTHFGNPFPFEQEEGESGMLHLREQFFELQHRRAPGVDWRVENDKVMLDAYKKKQAQPDQPEGPQTYADGKIRAAWFERGSLNQAGSIIGIDYVPATNNIYCISDGGTLWRRSLNVNDWTNLNKDLRFSSRQIQVIPNGNGGYRILTVIGKRVYYSDDEGANFTQATGWNYYDNWGGPIQLVATNNGTNVEVYYTVRTWDAGPWAPRVQLYYSADGGKTFALVTTFSHGNSDQVSMWRPYNTGDCYLLNQNTKLYSLDGANLNLLNNITSLPTNVNGQLRGYRALGGALTFYALVDNNKVYRSTNSGASWVLQGTMPSDPWSVGMEVALSNASRLFYGEVNCYKSTNAGASWTTVNEWWEYYGNVPGKLHADIMEIEFFRTSSNVEFALISNHGGLSVSYDLLATTQNLSLTGLNVSQYYSVRTDPTDPNFVYAGAQDQGYQRASTAADLPFDPVNFTQIVSGDYGHKGFSAPGTHFWKQYPGGDFSYHHTPKVGTSWSDSDWQLTGDDKPNVGWIVPAAEYAYAPSENKILVGGGNLNGGPGSHLIELTAATVSPYTISAIQDPYDFKPNANDGNSLISAIAVNPINGRRYVATDDGTFFYKNSNGNWQKATGFNGPDGQYLYGSCILPSKLNPDLVWFGGSGYSNPAVYKSTNGGQTFTSMSNGLPNTLVQAMAASPDEKFIFAATDAGPYVYDVDGNKWYSIRNADMPLQSIFSVEYIAARNLVRFGTFGRGIWDFAIDNMSVSGTVYPSNCGSASGSIDLKPTGGLAPVTYAWSTGATSQDLSGLPAGTYTVTVTDGNGFTQTFSADITSGGKPVKPSGLSLATGACGAVTAQWDGPSDGTYMLRYRQDNNPLWTVVGNIGAVKSYNLTLNPDNGQPYEVAVRYVCPGNQQSAWVSASGVLQDCMQGVEERERMHGEVVQTRIFPNPTTGLVTIQGADQGPIKVFDLQGRLVWTDNGMPGATGWQLDLSGVPNGVYLVRTGKTGAHRIVVAR